MKFNVGPRPANVVNHLPAAIHLASAPLAPSYSMHKLNSFHSSDFMPSCLAGLHPPTLFSNPPCLEMLRS